jgi:cellulose synthase/poly-beta-1,6-N-acetylglucosamine synthase-like glycosyltransferase
VTWLFVLAMLIPLQAYVGYPLSLFVLAMLRRRREARESGAWTPTVTLVISAYNEERWIRAKIENSLSIDYPRERLRIVVVSDGSTDATESIAASYRDRGVELRRFAGRHGKVACLNEVIGTLESELVVMSDANSMYEPGAIRRLVRHFQDPAVGCVCGRLAYVNPGAQAAGEGERIYWGYEGGIKRLESRIGSLLGANGSIYAYRPELFRVVDPLTFCDDVIPIRIAIGGRLVLYDPEAVCTEETADAHVEMRRRRRHASFGMRSMATVIGEAIPAGRWLVVYQCLSHRVLRWMGGPALVAMAVATPFLPGAIRLPAAALQIGFYGLAALGGLTGGLGRRLKPAYLAYYSVVIHLAGMAGLLRLFLRRDTPFWGPRQ